MKLFSLVLGGFLALPSTRLDGLYYALLTLGVAEICRVFVSQIKVLAPTNGSINQVGSFIPADWLLQRPGLLLGFFAAFALLLAALLVFRLINSERLGLFTTAPDVRCEAELADEQRDLGVIVSFVEAHALRGTQSGTWAINRNALDRLSCHLEVDTVGSGDREAQGNAGGVREYAALGSFFCAIRGVWTDVFATQRRLRHGAVHGEPAPVDPDELVVRQQPSTPELLKDSCLHPLHKPAVC